MTLGKVFRLLLVAQTLFLAGCIFGGPRNVKELNEEYTTLWGRAVAPPTFENHRLFLYVQLAPEDGQKEGAIRVCVAENKDNDDVLKRLVDRVVEADKPLYIFGQPVKGRWREYMEGVDFEIYAVGYYNPKAQKYQTVITTYGSGFSDMIRSIGWGNFLKMVGEKAVKTAIP